MRLAHRALIDALVLLMLCAAASTQAAKEGDEVNAQSLPKWIGTGEERGSVYKIQHATFTKLTLALVKPILYTHGKHEFPQLLLGGAR